MSICPASGHILTKEELAGRSWLVGASVEADMSVQLDSAVGERLKFGEFELAPVARALWRRGEEVRLGSRALDILIALASRPGQRDDAPHEVAALDFRVRQLRLCKGEHAAKSTHDLGGKICK